mmetsp:Transcript_12495/g.39488  ORF Transcript_12495/g.39488 Transcript_12495/m.39488 type:complete len:235 (+) Transcript_12495:1147-1851(+)
MARRYRSCTRREYCGTDRRRSNRFGSKGGGRLSTSASRRRARILASVGINSSGGRYESECIGWCSLGGGMRSAKGALANGSDQMSYRRFVSSATSGCPSLARRRAFLMIVRMARYSCFDASKAARRAGWFEMGAENLPNSTTEFSGAVGSMPVGNWRRAADRSESSSSSVSMTLAAFISDRTERQYSGSSTRPKKRSSSVSNLPAPAKGTSSSAYLLLTTPRFSNFCPAALYPK